MWFPNPVSRRQYTDVSSFLLRHVECLSGEQHRHLDEEAKSRRMSATCIVRRKQCNVSHCST